MPDTEKSPLMQAYAARIAAGGLSDDAQQRRILTAFATLLKSLEKLDSRPATRGGLLSWLRHDNVAAIIPGIYLWGEVGRGKTMLMDLFFDHLPAALPARRLHFHAFMTEIHEALHRFRQQHPNEADPLPQIAEDFAATCRLLCLDEFQVHDIADAMILSRLFEALLEEGVITVTTSNRPPDDLYQHGLQRESFLPFIALVKRRFQVLCLNHDTDYRLQKLRGSEVFFQPASNTAPLRQLFDSLRNHPPQPATITVKGRHLHFAETADGMVWSDFSTLCAAALGAEDYNTLAREFHTLFLSGIPQLKPENRNEARRFVHLVDALYEHHCRLICSADAPPQSLYATGDGNFEFQRTISRLIEMQSAAYLSGAHRG